MNKWIILHYAEKVYYSDNSTKILNHEYYVNFGACLVMERTEYNTFLVRLENINFDESPDEILAMLKEPDSELLKSAKSLIEHLSHYIYTLSPEEEKSAKEIWGKQFDDLKKVLGEK